MLLSSVIFRCHYYSERRLTGLPEPACLKFGFVTASSVLTQSRLGRALSLRAAFLQTLSCLDPRPLNPARALMSRRRTGHYWEDMSDLRDLPAVNTLATRTLPGLLILLLAQDRLHTCHFLQRQSHAPAATFPVGIPDSAGTIPLPLPAVESWVRGFPSALVKLKPAHCKVGCLYAYTSLSGQESDSVRPHLEGLMGPSRHLAEDPQMSLDRLITGKRHVRYG